MRTEFVGKPKAKTPFAGPRSRWEDNVKMDLKEIVGLCEGVNWIHLVQGRDRYTTDRHT
jgi:hypothetical protein